MRVTTDDEELTLADVVPDLLGTEPAWQESAQCAQVDPELFFPEKGKSAHPAIRICRACQVRAECLDDALGRDERFGVWGGLSERARRRLQKSLAGT